MAVTGHALGSRIKDVLGLGENIRSIVIRLEVGSPAIVEVQSFVPAVEADEIVTVIEQYELARREDAE